MTRHGQEILPPEEGHEDQGPATMERVYVRRDRNFTSLPKVRCPVCSREVGYPHKQQRPLCGHKPDQNRFSSYGIW